MSISPELLALLNAADADREFVTLHVALPGNRTVPINFQSTAASTQSFRTLRVVLGVPDGDEVPYVQNINRTLDVLGWLRDMCATEADRALLDELDTRGHLNAESLASMMTSLVELTAGRPSTPSLSSAAGSPTSGPTSTASLPQQEETFVSSPSINS